MIKITNRDGFYWIEYPFDYISEGLTNGFNDSHYDLQSVCNFVLGCTGTQYNRLSLILKNEEPEYRDMVLRAFRQYCAIDHSAVDCDKRKLIDV